MTALVTSEVWEVEHKTTRSSVRNRFNRDFTTINYVTPGRNFAERYSAEWQGFFKPKQTGTHRFYTYSDDSS